MISNEDVAGIQAAYAELLDSEVVPTCLIQRPNRSQDSTGAANASVWLIVSSLVPVIVEELGVKQTEQLKLRNDREIKESAYVLIMKHDVDVQPGDRVLVSGAEEPFMVNSVPRQSLKLVTEATCIHSRKLSDRT